MHILGPEKIVLCEITLFEDFGTTLCKDNRKIVLERGIALRRNHLRRGLPVPTLEVLGIN